MTLGGRTEHGGSSVHLFDEVVEVSAAEFPLEGLGDGLVVLLELEQTALDVVEGREVVWSESLSLDDGEVDLDLVEPARVDRAVNEHEIWESRLKAPDGSLTTVRGAVVDDPKDVARIAVGRGGHDLRDEAIEGLDAGGLLTTAEDLCSVHVEGSHVGPSATASVLVLDPCSLSGARRQGRMFADASLDAGLLVGADHELVGFEGFALPLAGVEIEDAPGLGGEVRIAREDPSAVLPGANGVFVEPAPHRLVADRGSDTAAANLAGDVGSAQPRKGKAQSNGQLTGESLYLHDDLWGEKPGAARGEVAPRGPANDPQRSACATGSRPRAEWRARRRSHRCVDPLLRAESSSLAGLQNTVTYIFSIDPPDRVAPLWLERSRMGSASASCILPTCGEGSQRPQDWQENTLLYLRR